MRDYDAEERLRAVQREQKRAKRRERKRREAKRRLVLTLGGGIGCVALVLAAVFMLQRAGDDKKEKAPAGETAFSQEETKERQPSPAKEEEAREEEKDGAPEEPKDSGKEGLPFADGYAVEVTEATSAVDEEAVLSTYALLWDLDENTVVAQRGAQERISPASMTKILTVLVAAEHVTDLDDTFTVTREITDYSYRNDCSAAGFDDGETVTVRDLFYGTVLPSGADAAAGLAVYTAGSLEGFTGLMNEKLEELGLSGTSHFTNCVGLYDENHYSTVSDMAVMLKAAVENGLCRDVLSAHIYTTSPTEQHPDGIVLSNWFLRRIEDKDTNGEVVCAKTGFVAQSGSCAASYEVSAGGKHYICVTADTYSSWRCIYDHVAMYQQYTM